MKKLPIALSLIVGSGIGCSIGAIGLDIGGLQDTTHRLNINLGIYF